MCPLWHHCAVSLLEQADSRRRRIGSANVLIYSNKWRKAKAQRQCGLLLSIINIWSSGEKAGTGETFLSIFFFAVFVLSFSEIPWILKFWNLSFLKLYFKSKWTQMQLIKLKHREKSLYPGENQKSWNEIKKKRQNHWTGIKKKKLRYFD